MKRIQDAELKFPRDWEYRIIFAEAARPITEEGVAEILMGRKVAVSAGESSRSGAYGTIVVRLRVNSRNEMEELAGKLSKVTGVKFLL
jgi:putative lipoic acid-binding regulatory protein